MRTSVCSLVLLTAIGIAVALFFRSHFPPMLYPTLALMLAGLAGGIAWDPNFQVPLYLWRHQPRDVRGPWPFWKQNVIGPPESIYLSPDAYLKRVPLSAFAKGALAGTPHLVRAIVSSGELLSDRTGHYFLLGTNWRLETTRLDQPYLRMHYQPPIDKVIVDPDITWMTKIDVPNPDRSWEEGARAVLSIVDRYDHVDEYLKDHPNHLVAA